MRTIQPAGSCSPKAGDLLDAGVGTGPKDLDLERADLPVLACPQIDPVAGLELCCPGELAQEDARLGL